ncbi:Potassium transporter KimA [Anaerolineales bacterium]|nr:Potassium transporter KimA [Anaerolineales bacterium]
MINKENNSQTPIIERTANYKPPRTLSSWLIGRPLSTADAVHETIGKGVGLAVFAADALSSNAYATQEILVILAMAGAQSFGYVFPISIAIVLLLTIVSISYEQIIHAYPEGGGAYIVARDNMGDVAALIAASSLLMDYILTVSVSISSGVAQIVSAFPEAYEYRVYIAVAAVNLVMLINLRGVKESGAAIAVPSFFFIISMFITLALGLVKYFTGSLGVVVDPPELVETHGALVAVTPFLILHAFSSGTSALTGIEAISNGITAFKEPRSKNAGITLIWMAVILASLFLGISFLTVQTNAVPSEFETVISQLARTVYGGQGILYIAVILATTVILILAANTAYAGFPRLSALMAKDGFLPRQFTYRGSRLVYSRGIAALAVVASILIVIFQASVTRLIPLYAIGVFLSFTFSQFGMALRWWKSGHLKSDQEIVVHGSTLRFDPLWKLKMVANGFGSLCTAVVMMVFAVTKFHDGAYIVLVLIPLSVGVLWLIHRHYNNLAKKLSLDNFGVIPPHAIRHRVIMPVSGVHQGTLAALRYARMLSDDVTAVHVVIEPADAEKVRAKWETWGGGVRMVLLDSPYRLFIEPILSYITDIANARQPGETITVVVPEFITDNRLAGTLHTNTANILREQLKNMHGIVITNVPYHVHEESIV